MSTPSHELKALLVGHETTCGGGAPEPMLLDPLIPLLPAALLPEALAAARGVRDPALRASLLGALAGRLGPQRDRLLVEAVAAADSVADAHDRAVMLGRLANAISPPREALVARALDAALQSYGASDALLEIGALLSSTQQRHALATLANEGHWWELEALVPHLTPALIDEALSIASKAKFPRDRAALYRVLGWRLSPDQVQLMLADVSAMEDNWASSALATVAPALPSAALPRAFDVARALGQPERDRAVSSLSVRLAELGQPSEAVGLAATLEDEATVADAIAGMAPFLPAREARAALARAADVSSPADRWIALAKVALVLPLTDRDDVLRAALTTALPAAREWPERVAWQLATVAPSLPGSLGSQATELVNAIEDPVAQLAGLIHVLPIAPERERAELEQRAVDLSRRLPLVRERAAALTLVVPLLGADAREYGLRETLDLIAALAEVDRREALLGKLLEGVGPRDQQRLLAPALRLAGPGAGIWQPLVHRLDELVTALPEDEQRRTLAPVIRSYRESAPLIRATGPPPSMRITTQLERQFSAYDWLRAWGERDEGAPEPEQLLDHGIEVEFAAIDPPPPLPPDDSPRPGAEGDGGSLDDRHISIWVREREGDDRRPLLPGRAYTLRMRVGAQVTASLASGDTIVPAADIPEAGLTTEWLLTSTTVELVGLDADTVGGRSTDETGETCWSANFELVIPKRDDSRTVELRIVPRQEGQSRIDVTIRAHDDPYRDLAVELRVESGEAHAPGPGAAVTVASESVRTPAAHLGVSSPVDWQRAPSKLELGLVPGGWMYVTGDVHAADGSVQHIAGEPCYWNVKEDDLRGPIRRTREGAEQLRVAFNDELNDIDRDDLWQRLARFAPCSDWGHLPDLADNAHREAWERIAASEELRRLATEGQALYGAFFRPGSDVRAWLDSLPPGARLSLNFQKGDLGIRQIPWGLMYVLDPSDPVNPMGFLALRARTSYSAHVTAPARRDLGAAARTWRSCSLYWGSADETSTEARWQRELWQGLPNHVFAPASEGPAAKVTLLKALTAPEPRPTSVIYLYCKSDVGDGSNPVLRFGNTNRDEDVVRRHELPTRKLVDRPLIFANACDTAASGPIYVNELERSFFDRECRAFLGTEVRVSPILASRFAATFFHFLQLRVDGWPMAAGEALAQTRLFLWSQYRNLGGLFYGYVNEFELFLADEPEILAMRRWS